MERPKKSPPTAVEGVNQDLSALKHARAELRVDKEVVVEAVKQEQRPPVVQEQKTGAA